MAGWLDSDFGLGPASGCAVNLGYSAADPTLRESLFVGRDKELARVQAELEAGHNLVLTGPFGIGRTTLLRHLARTRRADWRFVFLDGGQTPGRLCEQLLDVWAPDRPKSARRRVEPWTVERRQLPERLAREPRSVAVVLDDLGKATAPKREFLRWLHELTQVRVILVTEKFLGEQAELHLRALIYPAPKVTLGPLQEGPSRAFFESWARHHQLTWDAGTIHGLVLATRGYPTGMWQAAQDATGLSAAGGHGGGREDQPGS